jgi:predicted nucleic acid-binding Zn ribbon protein
MGYLCRYRKDCRHYRPYSTVCTAHYRECQLYFQRKVFRELDILWLYIGALIIILMTFTLYGLQQISLHRLAWLVLSLV